MTDYERKKIDSRVLDLLKLSFANRERCFFTFIGEDTKLQVVTLHTLFSKLQNRKATVCWCYHKSLNFTTNKVKKLRQIRRKRRKLSGEGEVFDDPFWLFQQGTKVRYAKYRDAKSLLGQTFDILVLTEVEHLSPSLLCQTIETVRGPGLVVFQFRTWEIFDKMQGVTLTVHEELGLKGSDVRPRFFQRMTKALRLCPNSLILTKDFECVPVTQPTFQKIASRANEKKVIDCKPAERDVRIAAFATKYTTQTNVYKMLSCCWTLDQAKLVFDLVNKLDFADPAYHLIVARRGRGKSAGIGIYLGFLLYTCSERKNILIFAPRSSNVQTVFEFIKQTLEVLGLLDSIDYFIRLASSDSDNGVTRDIGTVEIVATGSVVRFVDYNTLVNELSYGSVDLCVVDEAAAVDQDALRAVFDSAANVNCIFSSTVDGYEGSGVQLLRNIDEYLKQVNVSAKRYELTACIRYSDKDPIESWLYKLLCFETEKCDSCKSFVPVNVKLFSLNRDRLFEFSRESEQMLGNMMKFCYNHMPCIDADFILRISDADATDIVVGVDGAEVVAVFVLHFVAANSHSLEAQRNDSLFYLRQYYPRSRIESLNCVSLDFFAIHSGILDVKTKLLNNLLCYLAPQNSSERQSDSLSIELHGMSPVFHADYLLFYGDAQKNSDLLTHMTLVLIRKERELLSDNLYGVFLAELDNDKSIVPNWSTKFCVDFVKRLLTCVIYNFINIDADLLLRILETFFDKLRPIPSHDPGTSNKNKDIILQSAALFRLDAYKSDLKLCGTFTNSLSDRFLIQSYLLNIHPASGILTQEETAALIQILCNAAEPPVLFDKAFNAIVNYFCQLHLPIGNNYTH